MDEGLRGNPGSMQRALLSLVSAVLLPLLVVQMAVCLAWYHQRRHEEEQANLELAQAVAAGVDASIRDLLGDEASIGTALTSLEPFSRAQATRFLTVAVAQNPFVDSLSWIDAFGTVAAVSLPASDDTGWSIGPQPASRQSARSLPAIDRSVADQPYFVALSQGREFDVTHFAPSAKSPRGGVVVARRIEDSNGELQGVVAAVLQLQRFADVTGVARRTEEGSVEIFDGARQLVLRRPGTTARHPERTADDPLLDEVLATHEERAGAFRSPREGEELIAARVPIPLLGWVAGASRPVHVAMAEVYDALRLVIGLNLAVTIASLGAAAFMSRRIIRGLHRLQDHVHALGRGELAHRTEISGIRELQELALAFNRVGARIHDAQGELALANSRLEQRVAERTAELASTVDKLEGEVRERRRVEQKLQDSSQALEAIFRHSYTGLALLDPKFDFIRVNEAYARADQREISEFPGRNHFDIYPSDENEAIFREVVKTRKPFQAVGKPFEYSGHLERGVTYWDWALVPILNEDDEVEYLLFSLEDVTAQTRARQELETANAALERTAAQLRLLAWKLTRSEEQERHRLAQLLHDHLQQLLVAAKLEVETMVRRGAAPELRPHLALVFDWLNEAIAESRSLAVELSPPVLYRSGLAAALVWLGQRKADKYRLKVDVTADPEAEPSSVDTRVVLFQAVRELLFNVVKHARTDHATVRMRACEDAPDWVEIVVSDDGAGFDAAAMAGGTKEGFGIFGIRERLVTIGGSLAFDSAPGKGARITLRAPRDVSEGEREGIADAGSGVAAAGVGPERRGGAG